METLDALRNLKDFENLALSKMTANAKFYFSSGACSTVTPKQNEDAFQRYTIRPRVLRDVSKASTHSKILNADLVCPFGISPTGLQWLAHPGAEIATATGCSKEGCIFILSSVSSCLFEEVVQNIKNAKIENFILWMQVYIFQDRSVTLDFLKKAERLGFAAIVVTVDSPVGGLWRQNMPKDFLEVVKSRCPNLPSATYKMLDATLTFDDLKWMKGKTNLPIIVKGIMTGDDAKEAVQCGASAIFVSNHGARQIQRVVPTIDVLEEVVDAVKNSGVEVYLDGGIRSGTDIFITLALGADAAFIGRPSIWGLAVDGEEGVRRILQLLKEEFLLTMKLAGVFSVNEIDKSMIQKLS